MAGIMPDVLALVGLAALVAGVAWQFGPSWALMVAGSVLLVAGVAVAWRRNR